jgi:hypothetical protein
LFGGSVQEKVLVYKQNRIKYKKFILLLTCIVFKLIYFRK